MEKLPIARDGEDAALADSLRMLDRELAAGRERRQALREQYRALDSDVKSARALASDLAWEVEDLEQRMRDLAEQRGGPADPLLEREIASIAGRLAALEERMLAQMLQVDDLLARKQAAEQAMNDEERAWSAREPELTAERDRIASQLATHDPSE
jgi:predicted  nucleic acid-binding Zn-ribbon protein